MSTPGLVEGIGLRKGCPVRTRMSAAAVAGLLAVALFVGGCQVPTEAPAYGHDVMNYSSRLYVVRMTYQDGTVDVLVVTPESDAHGYSLSGARKAVVMDGQCSRQLSTLELSGNWAYIVIDESGQATIATSIHGLGNGTDLPWGPPATVSSSCS